MEKQTSIKLKIVALVVSLLVCFALIGISVWAAKNQNVSINNNISITTDGQTFVAVDVYEYLHKGEKAVTTAPNDEESWGEAKVQKSAQQDSVEGSVSPIIFSSSTGNNYYAYKIFFDNQSSGNVTATISATAVSETQISIFCGETWGSTMQSVSNGTPLNQTLSLQESGDGTFYIVVAVNKDLEKLTASDSSIPFNINITLSPAA